MTSFFVNRYADVRIFIRSLDSLGLPEEEVDKRITSLKGFRNAINGLDGRSNCESINKYLSGLDATVKNLFFYLPKYVRQGMDSANPAGFNRIRGSVVRECDSVIRCQGIIKTINYYFFRIIPKKTISTPTPQPVPPSHPNLQSKADPLNTTNPQLPRKSSERTSTKPIIPSPITPSADVKESEMSLDYTKTVSWPSNDIHTEYRSKADDINSMLCQFYAFNPVPEIPKEFLWNDNGILKVMALPAYDADKKSYFDAFPDLNGPTKELKIAVNLQNAIQAFLEKAVYPE